MKEIKRNFKLNNFTNSSYNLYFNNMSLVVLDIETTGLRPAYDNLILAGFLTVKNGVASFVQFFAENEADEYKVIKATIDMLSSFDCILTYNGSGFDIPFLKEIALRHGLNFCDHIYNLDLYKVIKNSSYIKKYVPNLKQKTIEQFMGISLNREDELSGQESVILYNEFSKTQNPVLMDKILLHNCDDVTQLYQLLNVIPLIDFHYAMFKMGFPAKPIDSNLQLHIQTISLTKNNLHVSGIQKKNPIDYMNFSTELIPYSSTFDTTSTKFEFYLPLTKYSTGIYADISFLGTSCFEFEKYPNYENGYLILAENNETNFLEINHLTKNMLNEIWEKANPNKK